MNLDLAQERSAVENAMDNTNGMYDFLAPYSQDAVNRAINSGGNKTIAILQAYMQQTAYAAGYDLWLAIDGQNGPSTQRAFIRYGQLTHSSSLIAERYRAIPDAILTSISPSSGAYTEIANENKRKLIILDGSEISSIRSAANAAIDQLKQQEGSELNDTKFALLSAIVQQLNNPSAEGIRQIQTTINSFCGKELNDGVASGALRSAQVSCDGIFGGEMAYIVKALSGTINQSHSQWVAEQEAALQNQANPIPEVDEWGRMAHDLKYTAHIMKGIVVEGHALIKDMALLVPKLLSGELQKEMGEVLSSIGDLSAVVYQGIKNGDITSEDGLRMVDMIKNAVQTRLNEIAAMPEEQQAEAIGSLLVDVIASCWGVKGAVGAVRNVPALLKSIRELPKAAQFVAFQEKILAATEATFGGPQLAYATATVGEAGAVAKNTATFSTTVSNANVVQATAFVASGESAINTATRAGASEGKLAASSDINLSTANKEALTTKTLDIKTFLDANGKGGAMDEVMVRSLDRIMDAAMKGDKVEGEAKVVEALTSQARRAAEAQEKLRAGGLSEQEAAACNSIIKTYVHNYERSYVARGGNVAEWRNEFSVGAEFLSNLEADLSTVKSNPFADAKYLERVVEKMEKGLGPAAYMSAPEIAANFKEIEILKMNDNLSKMTEIVKIINVKKGKLDIFEAEEFHDAIMRLDRFYSVLNNAKAGGILKEASSLK